MPCDNRRNSGVRQSRLDLGRYLAIMLGEAHRFDDPESFREYLAAHGVIPSICNPSDAEFAHLQVRTPELERTVDALLTSHGYEPFYNKGLVLQGAFPMGSVLANYEWELLRAQAPGPWFILSDRPVPDRFDCPFATALTYDFAVRIVPELCQATADLHALPATQDDVQRINTEVRVRAQKWICGPDGAIRSL